MSMLIQDTNAWREIVLENALDAVVGVDQNDEVIDWNKQAEIIFGWSKAETIGNKMSGMILPPELREAHRRGINHFLETGVGPILNKRIEMEAIHKDGHRFPVELTVIPFKTQDKYVFYSFVRDITDRRKVESQKEKSQEKLESILESLPACVAIFMGPEHIIEFANSVYLEVVEKKKSDMLGKRFHDVLTDETSVAAKKMLDGVLKSGETMLGSEMLYKEKYFNATLSPINEQGITTGVILFGFDVTNEVNSRRKAEESEKKLRLIMDASPAFISYIDIERRYQFANKVYHEWIAITNFEGRYMWEVLGSPYYQKIKPYLDKAFNGEAVVTETQYKAQDGRTVYLDAHYQPFIVDGVIKGIVVIVNDINERKLKEKDSALLMDLGKFFSLTADINKIADYTTERLAHHMECTRCWMNEIDDERAHTEIKNDYSEDLASVKGEYDLNAYGPDMINAWRSGNVLVLSDVTTDPRCATYASKYLARGMRSVLSFPLLREGRLIAALSVSSENIRIWNQREMNLLRSVAEIVWYRIDNIRLFSALQETIKARDEFISICSHELKTPVTSLKLQFQLGAKLIENHDPKAFDKELVTKRVASANKQLDRMIKLIEDMLDVSRIASGKMPDDHKPVDFYEMVVEVLERFKEQFEGLSIKVRLSPRPQGKTTVLGDRFRLEQVVSNLLTNAIKYGLNKPIEVSIATISHVIRISVQDQGIGIANENLDRIFYRFERAISPSVISGLGLGLYICREIVESHKGKIWVQSELGKGSVFHVALPLTFNHDKNDTL